MENKCVKHQQFLCLLQDIQETLNGYALTSAERHLIAYKEIYKTTRSVNLQAQVIACQKKCCAKKTCSQIYRVSFNDSMRLEPCQSLLEVFVELSQIDLLHAAIAEETRNKIHAEIVQRTSLRKLDLKIVSNVLSKNEWILTRLLKVIDGDTISVAVLTGQEALKVSVRILGIDCPETKKASAKEIQAGKLVGNHVTTLLKDLVRVKFTNVDKWGGRWLGYVELGGVGNCPCSCGARGICLSRYLLDKNYAKEYYGDKKEVWSERELDAIINDLK